MSQFVKLIYNATIITWYSFKSFKKLKYDSMDLMYGALLNVVSVSKGQNKKRYFKLLLKIKILLEWCRKLQSSISIMWQLIWQEKIIWGSGKVYIGKSEFAFLERIVTAIAHVVY